MTDEFLKYELRENKIQMGEQERLEIMTTLHEKNYISVEQVRENIVYKLETRTGPKVELSSEVEQKVYDEIRNSADKGLSKWDLKQRTKLSPNVISKFIKSLETKNLVKSFKAKSKGKQLFFAADCIPDEEEIGGNLYRDGEFDYEFLEQLKTRILQFVSKRKDADYKTLLAFVSSDVSGNLLNEKEIKMVVNVMILDKQVNFDFGKFSVGNKHRTDSAEIVKSVPCFKCPVFEICGTEGTISPKNCVYFENW